MSIKVSDYLAQLPLDEQEEIAVGTATLVLALVQKAAKVSRHAELMNQLKVGDLVRKHHFRKTHGKLVLVIEEPLYKVRAIRRPWVALDVAPDRHGNPIESEYHESYIS